MRGLIWMRVGIDLGSGQIRGEGSEKVEQKGSNSEA